RLYKRNFEAYISSTDQQHVPSGYCWVATFVFIISSSSMGSKANVMGNVLIDVSISFLHERCTKVEGGVSYGLLKVRLRLRDIVPPVRNITIQYVFHIIATTPRPHSDSSDVVFFEVTLLVRYYLKRVENREYCQGYLAIGRFHEKIQARLTTPTGRETGLFPIYISPSTVATSLTGTFSKSKYLRSSSTSESVSCIASLNYAPNTLFLGGRSYTVFLQSNLEPMEIRVPRKARRSLKIYRVSPVRIHCGNQTI
ncbi:hypothetical protein L9F63_015577, partial [Diploptera punctata]